MKKKTSIIADFAIFILCLMIVIMAFNGIDKKLGFYITLTCLLTLSYKGLVGLLNWIEEELKEKRRSKKKR